MGGGLLLRGIGKAAAKPSILGAGLAAASGAAASSSSTSARCINPSSSSMMQAVPSAAALRLAAADDWELAGDEERFECSVRDHLVFGSPPTRDEVADATSDLHNVLGLYAGDLENAPPPCQDSPLSPHRNSSSNEVASVHFGHPLEWVEPQLVSHTPGVVQVRRKNEVLDAFRLLQNDPVVQGVVMSIASDKAVWEAVLDNEKVKEFRKKLNEQEAPAGSEEVQKADEQKCTETTKEGVGPSVFASVLDYFGHLKTALMDMINSLLGYADKKFFSDKDGDIVDRALKSCFMLSVMVLSVVLVKRAAVA